MTLHHTLPFTLLLALGMTACGSAPPSQQADTAPLRSGLQTAQSVGEKSREVQAKNKDLVLYATSIEDNAKEKTDTPASTGRITVYSKPRGEIVLDGKPQGIFTPETIEAAKGEHEVQVIFEGGETSTVKTVRARKDSRIKLFFRDTDSPESQPDTAPKSTEPQPEATPETTAPDAPPTTP